MNSPEIPREARELVRRLKDEGRAADARTVRRLLRSWEGQYATLRDQHRQLRAAAVVVRSSLAGGARQ